MRAACLPSFRLHPSSLILHPSKLALYSELREYLPLPKYIDTSSTICSLM